MNIRITPQTEVRGGVFKNSYFYLGYPGFYSWYEGC
jgi:hypothetical protein